MVPADRTARGPLTQRQPVQRLVGVVYASWQEEHFVLTCYLVMTRTISRALLRGNINRMSQDRRG